MRSLIAERLETAVVAAARDGGGRFEPRPATCGSAALPLPGDLPKRGTVSAALSAEQRARVERRGGPLALAANAGSGKTSVLVERYVRSVLEDGVAPSRILAITFTDRAAGELRERIRLALATAGRRDAAHESLAAFISTFHGFCMRAAARARGAGRPPAGLRGARRRSGGGASRRGLRGAAARWIEQPGALELAAAFGVGELREAIARRLRRAAQPRHRDARAAGAAAAPEPGAAAALAHAAAAVAAELAAAEPRRRSARSTPEDCRRCSRSAPGAPAAIAELALRNGSSALASAAGAPTRTPARPTRRPARTLSARLRSSPRRPAARLRRALRRAQAPPRRSSTSTTSSSARGRCLREHGEVAALWSERFERVMVDELQDTNAAPDGAARSARARQPVHGRRRVPVDLRLPPRRRRALPRTPLARSPRLARPASCRSTSARARRCCAPSTPSSRGASANRSSPLEAGREEAARRRADRADRRRQRRGLEGARGGARCRARARSAVAARRGARARAANRRADRGGVAGAEEIVVLLRAATSMWVYEAALSDLGHATLATAGGGFFARPEVRDLISWLRALANPRDDLALYGVLASPLCGCSADELLELRLRAREADRSPWEVLEADAPAPAAPRSPRASQRARRRRGRAAVGELVAAAVADNGYDVHLATLHSPRAADRQRPQARAPRARLRAARGTRPAALRRGARARPRRLAARDRGAAAGRRHRRGPPDDDPRREGPRVRRRLPRRPRPRPPDGSRRCSPTTRASACACRRSSASRSTRSTSGAARGAQRGRGRARRSASPTSR